MSDERIDDGYVTARQLAKLTSSVDQLGAEIRDWTNDPRWMNSEWADALSKQTGFDFESRVSWLTDDGLERVLKLARYGLAAAVAKAAEASE